ncbi:hypothetical protein C1H46_009791 [Malus baccata]|uniref:Uncharacterized protein n=1 Tax=Malus baccata TaxID=106549 RepID=A0A540N0L1_MALBA|nr:hypothetical protein C1H46_009791 [Malus baccata]
MHLEFKIVTFHIDQQRGGDVPYMYMPTPHSMRYFGDSLASDSIGTLKLSEFEREHSQDG